MPTGNPDGNPRGSPRKKSGKSCEPKTPSPKKTRKSKGSTKTPKTPKAPQTPVSKGKRFRSKLQGSNSKRGDTMDYSSADEEIQRNYFSEAAPVHDIVASIEEEPGFQPMFPNFPAFPAETVIQPGYATNPE
ncbi:hypothetical protein M8818_001619 [Zalaria obscura]|uniref:Uncharacterized protein n=1 Tax=Zalaria obscura TaxID=2024903 RepID=A0ACC3SPN6_9PEZI